MMMTGVVAAAGSGGAATEGKLREILQLLSSQGDRIEKLSQELKSDTQEWVHWNYLGHSLLQRWILIKVEVTYMWQELSV